MKKIIGILVLLAGCDTMTQAPAAPSTTAAATCANTHGRLTFTDGTVLDCSDPTVVVTCAANDPSCLCRRMTGVLSQMSCMPCALQYPCQEDCECVADHGAGWTCVQASQPADPGYTFKGCAAK